MAGHPANKSVRPMLSKDCHTNMILHQKFIYFIDEYSCMELCRREMVATTGIALFTCGCMGFGSDSSQRLTLEAGITKAPEDPFTIDVEVIQSDITDSTPGKLSVEYQNLGDEQKVIRLKQARPHPRISKSESPGVVLEHPEKDIEQNKAGCWMPASDTISSTLGRPHTELQKGGQIEAAYKLWAHPGGKPDYTCLTKGVYRVPMPESAIIAIKLEES